MIKLKSLEFKNEGVLPTKYAYNKKNINPSLSFEDIPLETKSLVLIFEDLSALFGYRDHWLLWNISPDCFSIKENSIPRGALLGKNSFGETKYHGPNLYLPRKHKYRFTIFALDKILNLKSGAMRIELEEAITNHIIDDDKLLVFCR
jgi:hypothetical protein